MFGKRRGRILPLTPWSDDQVIKCEDNAVATNNLVKLTADRAKDICSQRSAAAEVDYVLLDLKNV